MRTILLWLARWIYGRYYAGNDAVRTALHDARASADGWRKAYLREKLERIVCQVRKTR